MMRPIFLLNHPSQNGLPHDTTKCLRLDLRVCSFPSWALHHHIPSKDSSVVTYLHLSVYQVMFAILPEVTIYALFATPPQGYRVQCLIVEPSIGV